MTAESNARSHAEEFRWNVGRADMAAEEARYQDLIALHAATAELVREQREMLGYYDAAAELGLSESCSVPGCASRGTARHDLLVFPTVESHSVFATLLPVTEEDIASAHAAAVEAAHGDSNDAELESLWRLVEVLMGALQVEGEVRP